METMSAAMISSRCGVILGGRHEFQRCAVDAVTKTSRFRAVLEDMPLMTFATGAMNLCAGENQFEVGVSLDHFRIDRLPEARPASATVKFVFRGIGRKITAGTVVGACFCVVVHVACERPFGRFMPQDLISLRCQQFLPFVIRLYDLDDLADVDLLCHDRLLFFAHPYIEISYGASWFDWDKRCSGTDVP